MALVDTIIEKGKEGLRRYKWPLGLLGSAGFALLTNKLSEGRGPVIYLCIVVILACLRGGVPADEQATRSNELRKGFFN
jgi:hypothetical protein